MLVLSKRSTSITTKAVGKSCMYDGARGLLLTTQSPPVKGGRPEGM